MRRIGFSPDVQPEFPAVGLSKQSDIPYHDENPTQNIVIIVKNNNDIEQLVNVNNRYDFVTTEVHL